MGATALRISNETVCGMERFLSSSFLSFRLLIDATSSGMFVIKDPSETIRSDVRLGKYGIIVLQTNPLELKIASSVTFRTGLAFGLSFVEIDDEAAGSVFSVLILALLVLEFALELELSLGLVLVLAALALALADK